MRQRKVLWALLILVAFAIGLEVLGSRVPLWSVRTSYCRFCRASKDERAVLGIRLSPVVSLGEFGEFWRREVEPGHRHEWMHLCTRNYSLMNHSIGCGGAPPWIGTVSAVEEAVLRGIPRSGRKALAEKLWSPRGEPPCLRDGPRWKKIDALDLAYLRDRHRKDWPAIVRKLGLAGP